MGEAAQKASITFQAFQENLNKYLEALEENYTQIENEYDNNIQILENAYDAAQQQELDDFTKHHEEIQTELEKIRVEIWNLTAKRHAAMEAARREEEIKQEKEYYSLKVSELDLNDIRMLEKIKPSLNKPRVLSMLIWTTWFRTPMTTLCNNILGTEKITGIYKITNQLNSKCYIGQSKDIKERFVQHAKCGLDIDCPAGNKLYKAMQEDGIWNFTWELLEICEAEQLNEREKFYIELYDSKNFGYNSTQGNK